VQPHRARASSPAMWSPKPGSPCTLGHVAYLSRRQTWARGSVNPPFKATGVTPQFPQPLSGGCRGTSWRRDQARTDEACTHTSRKLYLMFTHQAKTARLARTHACRSGRHSRPRGLNCASLPAPGLSTRAHPTRASSPPPQVHRHPRFALGCVSRATSGALHCALTDTAKAETKAHQDHPPSVPRDGTQSRVTQRASIQVS